MRKIFVENEAVFHLGESVGHTAFHDRSLERFLARYYCGEERFIVVSKD